MVVVTNGENIMELITRAKTHLSVIIVYGRLYAETKEYFQKAADLGLVEMVQLSGDEEEEETVDGNVEAMLGDLDIRQVEAEEGQEERDAWLVEISQADDEASVVEGEEEF